MPSPRRLFRSSLIAAVVAATVASGTAPAGAAQGDGSSSDLARTDLVSDTAGLARTDLVGDTAGLAPGDGGSITIKGGGFGHGIGMSQHGAAGRAAEGHGYQRILKHYYSGVQIQPTSNIPTVSVSLGTTTKAWFAPEGQARVKIDGALQATASAGQKIAVWRSDGRWKITVAGAGACGGGGCTGNTVSIAHNDGVPVTYEGTNHREAHGKYNLVPRNGGTVLDVVVAQLTMDEYLHGLAEMPSSWPTEALKAQAVAGRTYALTAIRDRRSRASWTAPFDLYATTSDQVYSGMAKSHGPYGDKWVAAVDATSRVVITYYGYPIQAFYGSSNGGRSETTAYVWGGYRPYLPVRNDNFDDGASNSLHRWTRTYPLSSLATWLGLGVGEIVDVEIVEDPPTYTIGGSGRVDHAKVVVTGKAGTAWIEGEDFRRKINSGLGSSIDPGLPSTKFEIASVAASDQPPIGKWKYAELVTTGTEPHAVISGWALDPDTADPIRISLTDNGAFRGSKPADDHRGFLDATYGLGNRHGFTKSLKLTPGVHELCVRAENHPDGAWVNLQCRTVRVGNSPTGAITSITSAVDETEPFTDPSVITVVGWAADKDTDGPVSVKVQLNVDAPVVVETVGGVFVARLETDRPGPHLVCATVLDDSGVRADTGLGCQAHEVADRDPLGKFQVATSGGGRVAVTGWTLDPDDPSPLMAGITVNGQPRAAGLSDDPKPSLATKYGLGPNHGFSFEFPLGPGTHDFCLVATDATSGRSGPVRCRAVTPG